GAGDRRRLRIAGGGDCARRRRDADLAGGAGRRYLGDPERRYPCADGGARVARGSRPVGGGRGGAGDGRRGVPAGEVGVVAGGGGEGGEGWRAERDGRGVRGRGRGGDRGGDFGVADAAGGAREVFAVGARAVSSLYHCGLPRLKIGAWALTCYDY